MLRSVIGFNTLLIKLTLFFFLLTSMNCCYFDETPWFPCIELREVVQLFPCVSVLWLRLVEVCIFCLCVLSLLQVAAVYRDPSVGNLINIMIVKLIIIHNEQVSARVVERYLCPGIQYGWRQRRCPWPGLFSVGPVWKDTAFLVSLKSPERSPWKTNGTIVRQLATCMWDSLWFVWSVGQALMLFIILYSDQPVVHYVCWS